MDLQLRLPIPSVQLWPQLAFGSANLLVPPLQRRRDRHHLRNQLRTLIAVDASKCFVEAQECGVEGVALGEGVRRDDQQRQSCSADTSLRLAELRSRASGQAGGPLSARTAPG